MNLRTKISSNFLKRIGIVGLFCFGMTGWCLKDGLFAWPQQQERANAYLAFEEENPDIDKKELFEMWKEVASEKGWEPGVGGKEKKTVSHSTR